jgi:hypothetical protein
MNLKFMDSDNVLEHDFLIGSIRLSDREPEMSFVLLSHGSFLQTFINSCLHRHAAGEMRVVALIGCRLRLQSKYTVQPE